MANPNSYDEHREKLINARMEAKAESRIRAKKEQPKVNKALAERLRRSEASAAKKGKSTGEEGGVLVDPRFKELFEDPEYEVDEQSRELALLNPATVHNANLANGKGSKKTAVEEEEDDSAASSGLEDDDDDDDEDEEEGSGDDSDEGDLQQYDPRKLHPDQEKRQLLRAYQYRPQLQAGQSSSGPTTASSFGQRLHSSKSKPVQKEDPRLSNVLAMRRSGDGGMEVSFVPTGSSKSEDRIEEGKSGRTKRRDPGRSASKNAFRKK
jgi:ribosome biogenesis protein ENP2